MSNFMERCESSEETCADYFTTEQPAQQQKGTSLPVVVQAAPQDGPPSPTAAGHHGSRQQTTG